MEIKLAGFPLRLLARLTDSVIHLTMYSLLFFWISQAATLADLVYKSVLCLIAVILPVLLTSLLFYYAWLTAKFGATPGKFLTGLKVVDENLHLLSYKLSFFRHSTGYAFSGLLFGLGFFSIIKDPNKQGWHDKAIGSKVVIVKNLWPLSLVILLSLLTINFILISSSINRILTGPLKGEFLEISKSFNQKNNGSELLKSSNRQKSIDKIYVLVDSGEYQGALEEAEKLLEMSSSNYDKAEAHFHIAQVYWYFQDRPAIREHLRMALDLKPEYPEAYSFLAELEIDVKNYQQALVYLQQAAVAYQDVAIYHNNLGVALRGLGRTEEAINHFKRAIELDPTNGTFNENLSNILKLNKSN